MVRTTNVPEAGNVDSQHAQALEGTISRVLGQMLGSPEGKTHEGMGTLVGNVAKSLVRKGDVFLGDLAEQHAGRFWLPQDKKKARGIGEAIWRYGVYAVPFAQETFGNIRTVYRQYAEEARRFSKLLGAGRHIRIDVYNYLNSDLEVVRHRRAQMKGLPSTLLRNTLMSTVNSAFGVADAMLESKLREASGRKNGRHGQSPTTKKQVFETLGKQDEIYGKLGFVKNILNEPVIANALEMAGKPVSLDAFEVPYQDSNNRQFLQGLIQRRSDQLRTIKGMLGGIANWAAPWIIGKAKDSRLGSLQHRFSKVDAAEMIFALEKALEESPNRLEIPTGQGGVPIEQFVQAIFQQHERDMGRGAIEGKAVEDLKVASKAIVEAIRNPNIGLHPQALGVLIDSKEGITLRPTPGKAASKRPVEGILTGQELTKKIYALRDNGFDMRKVEPAATYFGKRNFNELDLQQLFSKLDPEERSAIASFFSDAGLIKAGLTPDDVHKYRLEGFDLADAMITEMLRDSRTLTNSAMLERTGLEESDVRFLATVHQQTLRGNRRYIDENRNDIMDVLARFAMTMEARQDGYWQGVVERADNARRNVETAQVPAARHGGFSPEQFRRGGFGEEALAGSGLGREF